ncbi:DUF4381 domain-containing protein [Rhizobium mesoamericanum]|nr:DUF4381 domain-containing protein [Rhizobium mesoamericanum]
MEKAPALDPTTETALRSMHDIVVPAPVSWLPQTWGWGLLGSVAVALLLVWGFIALGRYRRNAYRREALQLLDAIRDDIRSPATRKDGIHRLSELMKRTALAAWPRLTVACLTGSDWNKFLKATSEEAPGRALEKLFDDFEYRAEASIDLLPANIGDDLVADARRWIVRHHVPA